MKVKGFDDREYSLTLEIGKSKGSTYHRKARILLKELYKMEYIYEEVRLYGSKTGTNKDLYADFFIPSQRQIIEVHGPQHFKYNTFHFKNKMEFFRAQARDRIKQEWCELNNIKLVVLNYNETLEEWTLKCQKQQN